MCFDEIEAAKNAEQELEGFELEGKTLNVCKFVKKADRLKAMKKTSDKSKGK